MNKSVCLILAACLGLAACGSERISHFPSYKLTIVQGNELDVQAVSMLRPGLSKEQVQHLLGTPLLRDPLHANRWDYTFNISRNGVVRDRKNLTLHFDENGGLARAEGDVLEHIRQQAAEQNAPAGDTVQ
ncbi:MAG: outer membrane protein assembly factor BamE [Eikenella sp.]|nr:outer membrane protein assembly factor BamE [Eikenella sp.]